MVFIRSQIHADSTILRPFVYSSQKWSSSKSVPFWVNLWSTHFPFKLVDWWGNSTVTLIDLNPLIPVLYQNYFANLEILINIKDYNYNLLVIIHIFSGKYRECFFWATSKVLSHLQRNNDLSRIFFSMASDCRWNLENLWNKETRLTK